MTELSRVWDGTAIGDATDASYDSSEFAELLQALSTAEAIPTNKSGVFRGVDNLLGYTIGSNKVTIASGKALVAGRWYRNTAPLDLTIGNASVGRRDRVVLRRDTSAQTVRLTVLTGIDNGGGVAPTMTQDASTWDEPLYIFNKAPGVGAAISIIADNREYIPRHGDVSGEGAAALHAASQISGLPASADSTPINVGLTRTASIGSDSGHYANDDHVHRVDPIPSGYLANHQSSAGLGVTLTELGFALAVGVAYIVEGGFYISSFGGPPNLGVTVNISIGTMVSGGAIGNDINDPTQIDSVISAGGFTMGPGYTHFSAIGISTGASVVSFIPYPSGSAAILAGSWLRATPVT